MAKLLDALSERILLCDGGTGTSVHTHNLTVKDYWGHENCTEILVRSRPDVVRSVQRAFYAAGADVVETNTFGGSPITLGEFGLESEAYAINKEATELLREVADEFKADGRQRWVIGDVGPGTKLASLGHIDYDTLEDSFAVQCAGLIDGGVDGILLLTFQDPLQLKAAANGAKRAREAAGSDVPIFAQVTLETTGAMLVGTDIAAAATVVRALEVPLVGMNCATGPEHMAAHMRWLGRNWPGLIAVQPNGGLPELVDGHVCYPLSPAVLASWLERFLEEHAVNLVGGCCGTGPEHIAAVDAMLRRRAPRGSHRPLRVKRQATWRPALASLYRQAQLRRDDRAFLISSAGGSSAGSPFCGAVAAEDWEACVALARAEEGAGSDAILLSAPPGAGETRALVELTSRLRGVLTVPLVLRSRSAETVGAALKLYGGKALIDPVEPLVEMAGGAQIVRQARRLGAAVLARIPASDVGENAVERALARAAGARELACAMGGLAAEDLLLAVEIPALGDAPHVVVRAALEVIGRICTEHPAATTVVDVSRLTEGLGDGPGRVLTHTFVELARARGAAAAIMHVSRLGTILQAPKALVEAASALLGCGSGADTAAPLTVSAFVSLCGKLLQNARQEPDERVPVGARLARRIIDGNRQGMEADLDEALADHAPLGIITEFLLAGMKTVGDQFGDGRIPLPHVLQSAETMKAAVAHLEPRMDRAVGHTSGTIVLATVKGDIHDIGKNLVDIVLSNSGFRTINIGSKQPVEAILAAAREHKADAIGMSGLLLNSAIVMRNNLAELARQRVDLPVLLGGAALSRRFVAEHCAPAYASGRVAYAADVFDGLRLMDAVSRQKFDSLATKASSRADAGESGSDPAPELHELVERPIEPAQSSPERSDLQRDNALPPTPPFYGARRLEMSMDALLPFLNRRMLFMFHWGYKKAGRSLEQWRVWSEERLGPLLDDLLQRCRQDGIIAPSAVYGYWKCASDGDELVLFEEDGQTEAARLRFPRQRRPGGYCISDFFRRIEAAGRDVVALQAVTVGQRASDVAREWYRADRYTDYLYLHGLAVELTEAAAEFVHRKIRDELGIVQHDAPDREALLRQGYRGARYSFGYPALPSMDDQRVVLRLLDARRIGVSMGEEAQMHPELATCALVVHHPQARYFVV